MTYEEKITPYLIEADSIIKSLINAMSPLYSPEFPAGQEVTVPLFTALHSYSESVLILLQHRGIFEADIILRAIMEGSVKYCFLMRGADEERAKKLIEYQRALLSFEKVSDHKKAKEAIEILNHFTSNSTKPFEAMLLDETLVSQIEDSYSRREKAELESKWKYQALLRSLAQDSKEYEAQLGSLATYAQTSHFIHLDWSGVQQIQSSIVCGEESYKYGYGHALRIISNVLSIYAFRVLEYMQCNKSFPPPIVSLCNSLIHLDTRINSELNQLIESEVTKVDL